MKEKLIKLTRRTFIVGIIVMFFVGVYRGFGRKLRPMFGKLYGRIRYRRISSVDEKNSKIYISKNGTPQQNMEKVIEMMGGIETYIQKNDIVILKPNLQWWNQGRTNLAAMKRLIDRSFFRGCAKVSYSKRIGSKLE